jgi:glycosyltransferase involved in cell wall biosynthesis
MTSTFSVSVIIPTYNRAHVLERAINSVFKQTFRDFELIIIDDGSDDETPKLLEKICAQNKNCVSYTIENSGVSKARNIGVEKSSGEWVAFLDSDDEWLPHKLERQMSFISHHKNVPLVHGEEIWVRNGKRVNPKKKHQKFGGDIFLKCLPLCVISPSASIIKKKIYLEMGGFDESFPVCEDYDLWLKITSLYPVGFIEDPIITKYGGHEDQLSRKYFAMDFWRVRALKNILQKRSLSEEIKKDVIDEILYKANILKQGYIKHQNHENLAFILEVIEEFSN